MAWEERDVAWEERDVAWKEDSLARHGYLPGRYPTDLELVIIFLHFPFPV